jgi:hypothetical protein
MLQSPWVVVRSLHSPWRAGLCCAAFCSRHCAWGLWRVPAVGDGRVLQVLQRTTLWVA